MVPATDNCETAPGEYYIAVTPRLQSTDYMLLAAVSIPNKVQHHPKLQNVAVFAPFLAMMRGPVALHGYSTDVLNTLAEHFLGMALDCLL